MEFEYPAEVEQFRAELRAFLDAELPEWWKGLFHDDDRIYPFTREFCMKLAERDWLTMSKPRQVPPPASGVSRPHIIRIVVVLPLPFGPRKP